MEDLHKDILDIKLLLYDLQEKQSEQINHLKFITDLIRFIFFIYIVKFIATIGIIIYFMKSGADVIRTIM